MADELLGTSWKELALSVHWNKEVAYKNEEFELSGCLIIAKMTEVEKRASITMVALWVVHRYKDLGWLE